MHIQKSQYLLITDMKCRSETRFGYFPNYKSNPPLLTNTITYDN